MGIVKTSLSTDFSRPFTKGGPTKEVTPDSARSNSKFSIVQARDANKPETQFSLPPHCVAD